MNENRMRNSHRQVKFIVELKGEDAKFHIKIDYETLLLILLC